jgi:hypothetical protein
MRDDRGSGFRGWPGPAAAVIAQSRAGVAPNEQRDERPDPGIGEPVSDLLYLAVDELGTDPVVVRLMQGPHHDAEVAGELGMPSIGTSIGT